jgi:hypothetical protein
MECERCGQWAPADRETGWDGDTLCVACQQIGNEREPEDAAFDGLVRIVASMQAHVCVEELPETEHTLKWARKLEGLMRGLVEAAAERQRELTQEGEDRSWAV